MAEGGHDEGQEGAAGGSHQGHQLTKVRHLQQSGRGQVYKTSSALLEICITYISTAQLNFDCEKLRFDISFLDLG